MKIVLTGGGSGGHVYPAIAVAEKLDGFEKHFIGSGEVEEKIFAHQKDITFHKIKATKFERSLSPRNLLIPFKLFASVKNAKKLLLKIQPDIVFSKGGYASLPVVIAARLCKIKIVAHESDLTFGLANKIALRLCDKMCTSFASTGKGCAKVVYTGQPIRKEALRGRKSKIATLAQFEEKPNLLILGGSLGSKKINEFVRENKKYLMRRYNIVLICGNKGGETFSDKNFYQTPYANNIGDFYKWADVAVSRAGSGAINELLANAIPSLLIPLSKNASRGDQLENAKYFERRNLAQVLTEDNLSIGEFVAKLDNLLKNSQNLQKNMKKALNFDSSTKIAEVITEIINLKN